MHGHRSPLGQDNLKQKSRTCSMSCYYRLLDHIDPDIKQRLLEGHLELQIPAGHQLILQADWGQETYVLSTGILKARSNSFMGDETVIALMGSGAIIGEVTLLLEEPLRTMDVVAVTPASLLKLRPHSMRQLMLENISFLRAVALLQAQRLIAVGNRLILMNQDATTRLLAILLDLAYLSGNGSDPYHPIPPISQQEIAIIAGLSRGTTSTCINKLLSNGTIKRCGAGLTFANLDPLVKRGLL